MARRPRSNKRRLDRRRQLDELIGNAGQSARRFGPYICVALIALGLPFAIYRAYLHTVSGQTFELEHIEVKGTTWLDPQQITTQAHLSSGLNLLDLDLVATEQRLVQHPWIKSATIERVIPDRLVVRIKEHEPVAVLIDGADMVLVDRDGVPFKTIDNSDPIDRLLGNFHLISGSSKERLDQASPSYLAERKRLIEAFGALSVYHKLGLNRVAKISEVHLDSVVGVSMILEQTGVEVRLGWGRYDERLRRFKQVYESLVEKDIQVDYILIDQDEDLSRVAVGLAMAKDGNQSKPPQP